MLQVLPRADRRRAGRAVQPLPASGAPARYPARQRVAVGSLSPFPRFRGAIAALLLFAPGAAAAQDGLADLKALVGSPPAAGSPVQLADGAAMGLDVPPERVWLASRDQILDPFLAFAEVLGPSFTPSQMPATADLLYDVMIRTASALASAKDLFPRDRPYHAKPELARCVPGPEGLDPTRSYPSTHAAIGLAWALVLTEVAPGRAGAIMARGLDYGASRTICGVHWPSDVAAGQRLAAAIVAVLHGDAVFREAVEAARAEAAVLE